MGERFSSGKFAISQCDRCGFRFKLKRLKYEVVKTKLYQLKVCPECWDPDHPQLQLVCILWTIHKLFVSRVQIQRITLQV